MKSKKSNGTFRMKSFNLANFIGRQLTKIQKKPVLTNPKDLTQTSDSESEKINLKIKKYMEKSEELYKLNYDEIHFHELTKLIRNLRKIYNAKGTVNDVDVKALAKTFIKILKKVEEGFKKDVENIEKMELDNVEFLLDNLNAYIFGDSANENTIKKLQASLRPLIEIVEKRKSTLLSTLTPEEKYQREFERAVEKRENSVYTMEKFKSYLKILQNSLKNANEILKKQGKKLIICNYKITFGKKEIKNKNFYMKEIKKVRELYIKAFKKQGLKLNDFFVENINKDSKRWKTIENKVELTSESGETVNFDCSVTPARELGFLGYFKKEKIHGISSMDRDTPHAMNMWQSEVKNKKGQTVVKILRHGNTRGKESSTKEIILAAAVQQYGLDNILKNYSKVWEVKLGNMQLMSPSKVLLLGRKVYDGKMPFKQMDTFKKLEGKTFNYEIPIPETDKTQKIKLKLVASILFNFGSNMQQYSRVMNLAMANKENKKRNKESMEKLFGKKLDISEGEVANFLKSNDDEKKNKIVKELSNQIIDIWKRGEYERNASEPYAIQSRITYLMYLLGFPVSINCKSGKDRTGMMNAEVVNLATYIEMNGEIPQPYANLSKLQKANMSKSVNASGAYDIAETNQGLGGLKIEETAAKGIIRFEGVENRAGRVKGVSKLAKS